jgi:RHS repeat-associated protein
LAYRFGFNGKEDDRETGTQDYGFRIYNPQLGKFLSVDPLTKEYPELTPYQFASNSPIRHIDLDGLEAAAPPLPGNAPPPGTPFKYFRATSQNGTLYQQTFYSDLSQQCAAKYDNENSQNGGLGVPVSSTTVNQPNYGRARRVYCGASPQITTTTTTNIVSQVQFNGISSNNNVNPSTITNRQFILPAGTVTNATITVDPLMNEGNLINLNTSTGTNLWNNGNSQTTRSSGNIPNMIGGGTYNVQQIPQNLGSSSDGWSYSINVTTQQTSTTTSITPGQPAFSSPGLPTTQPAPVNRTQNNTITNNPKQLNTLGQ